jgi:hypothetical protein
MLNKQSGNYYLNAALGTISPGFQYNDLGSQWFADRIAGHIVNGYRWYEADGLFRRKSVFLAYNRSLDYEGNTNRNGFYTTNYFQFMNFWSIRLSGSYDFESISTTLTRGGPKVINPARHSFYLSANTDNREKLILSPFVNYWANELGSRGYSVGAELVWRPSPQIDFSIGPEWMYDFNVTQWVGNFEDEHAAATYNTRYVFGELDQMILSANIRLNWTFTPSLSLQLFMQPLFAVGNYSQFKELSSPSSKNYNLYGQNGSEITYDNKTDEYIVDPDVNGTSDQFSFKNPDFNFKSLRGSVVLRWEYLPGSVFYFVWTHDKINHDDPGSMSLKRDFQNLWVSEANNVLLVKFSYWIDI